jgi:hypothetical protein
MKASSIGIAGVASVVVGMGVSMACPLYSHGNSLPRRITFLASLSVQAAGVLLLLAWGCLVIVAAWRGWREEHRRGFAVVPSSHGPPVKQGPGRSDSVGPRLLEATPSSAGSRFTPRLTDKMP